MFQSIFDTRLRELWSLYEATGELKHQGEKGLLRELFLRRLVESILPPHFAVGSGIIVDTWARQSPQVDLLIYDRRRMPPILEEHGHGIYPVDAVLRVIEVKSLLDKDGLEQFGKLVHALNPLNPDGLKMASPGTLPNGYSFYPFASLFAYRTTLLDIEGTKSSFEAFAGAIAPICAISHPSSSCQQLPMEELIRLFLVEVFNRIEESASSRKMFGVSEWLLRRS